MGGGARCKAASGEASAARTTGKASYSRFHCGGNGNRNSRRGEQLLQTCAAVTENPFEVTQDAGAGDRKAKNAARRLEVNVIAHQDTVRDGLEAVCVDPATERALTLLLDEQDVR